MTLKVFDVKITNHMMLRVIILVCIMLKDIVWVYSKIIVFLKGSLTPMFFKMIEFEIIAFFNPLNYVVL